MISLNERQAEALVLLLRTGEHRHTETPWSDPPPRVVDIVLMGEYLPPDGALGHPGGFTLGVVERETERVWHITVLGITWPLEVDDAARREIRLAGQRR